MSQRQPGDDPYPARRSRGEQACERPSSGQFSRASGDARVPAALALAITLMDETAHTEWDVAQTLENLAGRDEGEAAARRRMLAKDAIEGAHAALRRGDQLRQLASRWAERDDLRTLQRLLHDAADALTRLARIEQSIADTLASLAARDEPEEPERAAERRRMAVAAHVHARSARDRAEEVRRLARTSVAGESRNRGALGPDAG